MEIFEVTKSFPKEEKYSLTDQIRRSSRSVCSNLGEEYRKRLYPAHFVSKVSDADMENWKHRSGLSFPWHVAISGRKSTLGLQQNQRKLISCCFS